MSISRSRGKQPHQSQSALSDPSTESSVEGDSGSISQSGVPLGPNMPMARVHAAASELNTLDTTFATPTDSSQYVGGSMVIEGGQGPLPAYAPVIASSPSNFDLSSFPFPSATLDPHEAANSSPNRTIQTLANYLALQHLTSSRSVGYSLLATRPGSSYAQNVSDMAGEVRSQPPLEGTSPPAGASKIPSLRELIEPTSSSQVFSSKTVNPRSPQGSELSVADFLNKAHSSTSEANSPNLLKRPGSGSLEPADYPRRRAIIACEVCRSRKSRCDGGKPKCRLCTELKADCVYREPGVKLDAGDKMILERLSRIESLLSEAGVPGLGVTTTTKSSSINSPANTASPGGDDHNTLSTGSTIGGGGNASSRNGMGTWSTNSQQGNVSNMPKSHTTPALNLLSWPKIRTLVSKKWDPGAIVQQEMQRASLDVTLSSRRPLDFTNAQVYIREFFESVNLWYACVSPFKWNAIYAIARSRNFRPCPESCLVLLVTALGAASRGGSISRIPEGTEPPGMEFFAAAWAMLPSLMLRTDVLTTQCQMLTAAYLFYIVRPLEAWNMLVSISLKLQLLITINLAPSDKQVCERIYWNTLLFESDLLAEMELPHSGIVQLEELFGLPGAFEPDGETPIAPDYLWYFLAEIGLRRLLNRVSNSIYSISSPITNTAILEPIVSELDSQLMRWYNGLPAPVRFELQTGRNPAATAAQTVLRLRYFACRTIIFRPYVLAVLINESAFMDPPVEDGCRKCLEACIRQLEHITAHHAGHLPYIFQGALSIVSQTLLVMGATLSPILSALLPAQNQMNAIIDDVVEEIERYARLAPSLRLSADILREADNRRRLELTAPLPASGS